MGYRGRKTEREKRQKKKKDNERDVASIYSSAGRNTTIKRLYNHNKHILVTIVTVILTFSCYIRVFSANPSPSDPPFDRFDSYALLWTFLGFLFYSYWVGLVGFFTKGKGPRKFFSPSILILIPIVRFFPFSHCRIFFRFIFPFCVHFFVKGRSFGWCSDSRLFF